MKDHDDYATLERALVADYRTDSQLPDSWLEHLNLMIALRHATNAPWVIGLQRNGGATEEFPRMHVEYRLAEVAASL